MVGYLIGGSLCCDGNATGPIVISAGTIGYLETIAQLRAAQITGTGDSVAIVGGYYAQGDGGGGLYLWEPSEALADNGGTIINQSGNIGAGRWVLQNFGQPITIKQFGAKMDGATDDTAVINIALATVDDLVVPAGSSYIAGTLLMLRDGQKFHGVGPAADDAGSKLIFGPGQMDCINLGDVAQTEHLVYVGQQLYDLTLACALRIGAPGFPNPTIPTPSRNTTCCAVSLLNCANSVVSRLNIMSAWNGLFNFCGSLVSYEDIVFSNTRGDFNELHYGVAGDPAYGSSGANISHGALPDVQGATSAGIAVGNFVPMADTSDLFPGWAVSGSGGAFPDASIVTAVSPTGVTINANITSLLAAGTVLTFQNQTIGLWLGSFTQDYEGRAIRARTVATVLLIDDTVSSGTSAPQDVRIYDLNGSLLGRNDKILINAGQDINLTEVSVLGSIAAGQSGRGLVMGGSAQALRVVGGLFAYHTLAGLSLSGTGCQLIGCIVGLNSQTADSAYDGIAVGGGGARIVISGCTIGAVFGANGQQRYGVNNLGANPIQILLVGNNMKGNTAGAVNDPSLFTLGTNVGLSTGATGVLYNATQYLVANLGIAPTRTRAFLMDDLIRALDDALIWGVTDLLYLFAASDVLTALTNWKLPGAGTENPIAVRNGTAPFVQDAGFTSDGTTGYIDFGVAPNQLTNFTLNSAAAYVYSKTNVASDTGIDLGLSAATLVQINGRNVANKLITEANAASSGNDAVADSLGMYGFSRSIAGSYKTHKNAAVLSTQAIPSSLLPASNIWALRGPAGFSPRQIAGVWIGGQLSDAQVALLYAALNTYITAV